MPKQLTPELASIIKARLRRGEFQYVIAADYVINQGRVSEINTGKKFADVAPANLNDPPAAKTGSAK